VFLSEFAKLAQALKDDLEVQNEQTPSDISDEMVSLLLPRLGLDVCPWLSCSQLGEVSSDVKTN